MKVRDNDMPNEALWESLFDVDLILRRLAIDARLVDVAELGCDYGTFTLPVAERISGMLHTYDIDEVMVAHTKERISRVGLNDVVVERRDVMTQGFGLPPWHYGLKLTRADAPDEGLLGRPAEGSRQGA